MFGMCATRIEAYFRYKIDDLIKKINCITAKICILCLGTVLNS